MHNNLLCVFVATQTTFPGTSVHAVQSRGELVREETAEVATEQPHCRAAFRGAVRKTGHQVHRNVGGEAVVRVSFYANVDSKCKLLIGLSAHCLGCVIVTLTSTSSTVRSMYCSRRVTRLGRSSCQCISSAGSSGGGPSSELALGEGSRVGRVTELEGGVSECSAGSIGVSDSLISGTTQWALWRAESCHHAR